jgi:hypothetical protein
MKNALIGLCAALIAGAAHAADAPDLKPGLWETRPLKLATDGRDMLPQMRERMNKQLAALSPAERKEVDTLVGVQGGDPMVQRLCLRAGLNVSDDLLRSRLLGIPDCGGTPEYRRDGSRIHVQVACQNDWLTTAIQSEIVTDGERITARTGATLTTVASGKAKATVTRLEIETQMTFIGGDCGGLKPLDQIAREMQAGEAPPRP